MRGARRDNRIAEPVAQLTFKWAYLNVRDGASVLPTDIGDSLVWHNARHRDGNVSGLTPGKIKRQSLPTPKMAG
jgi:hypothetical protein